MLPRNPVNGKALPWCPVPPEPPQGGGGGATDPRDPDLAWGWEPAGKSHLLLSLSNSLVGGHGGFQRTGRTGQAAFVRK